MNTIQYSNNDLILHCDQIISSYEKDNGRPDLIVGIIRGGLVPSVYISHRSSSPLLTVNVSFRDNDILDESSFVPVDRYITEGKKVLFVDDLTDSGKTLEVISTRYNGIANVKTAVLLHNTGQTNCIPDYFGNIIDKTTDGRWIVFPWEVI